MRLAWRPLTYVMGFAILGAYAYYTLRGPQGIPALLEKRREVRALQEQNADLQREIQYRREYVERLSRSPAEQEKQVREKLKLLRPGETQFILPEEPKKPAEPKPNSTPE